MCKYTEYFQSRQVIIFVMLCSEEWPGGKFPDGRLCVEGREMLRGLSITNNLQAHLF